MGLLEGYGYVSNRTIANILSLENAEKNESMMFLISLKRDFLSITNKQRKGPSVAPLITCGQVTTGSKATKQPCLLSTVVENKKLCSKRQVAGAGTGG